jgi:hypothetical protein
MGELDKYLDHPVAVPALAGLTTGVLYKSTRGLRASLLAGNLQVFHIRSIHIRSAIHLLKQIYFHFLGAIGTGVSVTYSLTSSYVYNVILGKGGRY